MKRGFDFSAHAGNLKEILFSSALVLPVAVLAGSASAFFLWALDEATKLRFANPWLLFLLPLGGLVIAWLYLEFGGRAEAGTNLIMDEIHEPGGGVPRRMAPLVLAGTLVTHLLGGSAGREGTAVQMGGSLASAYARLARIPAAHMRVLLMAGIAAGFGSVFGTPLAGAVFAMEVLVIGRVQYDALIPVLVASVVGDYVCSAWGIHHGTYRIEFGASTGPLHFLDAPLFGKIALAAVAFGLASRLFAELTHSVKRVLLRYVASPLLRPVLGGALVISLVYLVGTRDYLGIGIDSPHPGAVTIYSAFQPNGATPWSWWWKLLFTAVTLGSGFKGGEVTPLFFIGATLGHTLATLLGAPVDLFAALGFIAVFAGATNTPLACTLMGIELFGGHHAVYFALSCFVAYLFSGPTGVYSAQLTDGKKSGALVATKGGGHPST